MWSGSLKNIRPVQVSRTDPGSYYSDAQKTIESAAALMRDTFAS